MKSPWSLLPLLCLATFAGVLSTNIVMTVLVPIAAAFPGVSGVADWTLLAYSLTAATLSIPAGDWGDRYGLRFLFRIGLLLFVTGSIAGALAPSAELLIASRVLAGSGSAIQAPVALAYLSRLFQGADRPVAFGYWSASVTLATVLGPVIGGWIAAVAGWRVVFPFAGIPALLVLLWLRRLPPCRPLQTPPPMDVPGLASLAILPALLLVVLTEGDRWPLPWTGAVLLVVGVLAAATWRHLRRTPQPAIPLQQLTEDRWWRPSLLQLLIRCLFMATLLLLTIDLQIVRGLPPQRASLGLLPFSLTVGVMALSSGHLSRLLGSRRLLQAMFALASAGLLLVLPLSPAGPTPRTWFGLLTVAVLCGSTAQLSRLAMASFPQQAAMRGAALNTLIINIGLSLGAVLPAVLMHLLLPRRLAAVPGWPAAALHGRVMQLPTLLEQLARGSTPQLQRWMGELHEAVSAVLSWQAGLSLVLCLAGLLMAGGLLTERPPRSAPGPGSR